MRLNIAATLLLSALAATSALPANVAAVAVGAQYDSTHVYVAPEDVEPFTVSFLATFGGQASKPAVATVTPTASSTVWQALQTPVGNVSVFGFKTPVPYPFGAERTGYLVTDMDLALRAARANGADVLVGAFPDAIGRDAIIQWPGGVNMQLYWHKIAPSGKPLQSIPENRVYISADRAEVFVRDFVRFSHGKVVSDDHRAPGIEIGQPGTSYRRIRIESTFGRMSVCVSDGHLPYPYGREITGYEVANLAETLDKARAAGVTVLVVPYTAERREAAIVRFPGGYIAEIHALK